MSPPGFRLLGAPPGLEGLGPWRAGADDGRGVVWQVQLAGAAPAAALGEAAASLRRADQALGAVPDRLQRAMTRIEEVSFAAPEAMRSAERALMGALRADAEGMPSYGLGDVGDKAKAALAAIAELVTRHALVETLQGPRLVARTRMALGGDTDTLTHPLLTPADARLHGEALALARSSRDAWMRILGLTTGAAAQLMAAATNPAAAVAALPRAWRFVKDILTEVGAL